MEFKYDGGGLGKGGMATLYVDGKQVGQGRVEHTHAVVFSADSVTEVGNKTGAPIYKDFGVRGNLIIPPLVSSFHQSSDCTEEDVQDAHRRTHRHMTYGIFRIGGIVSNLLI